MPNLSLPTGPAFLRDLDALRPQPLDRLGLVTALSSVYFFQV